MMSDLMSELVQRFDQRYVPAWMVGIEDSTGQFVHILTSEVAADGWARTRLVDRLLPVDWAEQQQYEQIKPDWAR